MAKRIETPPRGAATVGAANAAPDAERWDDADRWDEVAQASWDSFPASDPPPWTGRGPQRDPDIRQFPSGGQRR